METNFGDHLKPLSVVREEHTAWYGALLRQALYPSDVKIVGVIAPPQSFTDWMKSAGGTPSLSLIRLAKIHEDLHLAGAQFANTSSNPASFDRLRILFEEFLNHLARLEQDSLMENSGLDPVSGLRSKTVMMSDLDRELHRFARQGRSFTIAIAKIDDYENIAKSVSPDQLAHYIRQLGILIQKSIRSFDDAYASDPGEFVLSFKQSSIAGGFRALERLRVLLQQDPIELNINGQINLLTLSCCVGEPYPGDDLNTLLKDLRRDLVGSAREPGTVLKYHELPPVKRFVTTPG